MDFEWDETKNQSNYVKHGISFEEATKIFDGVVLTREDPRPYGEVRKLSYGKIADELVIAAVVHTDRDGWIRIISARVASRKERELYNVYLASTAGRAGSDP